MYVNLVIVNVGKTCNLQRCVYSPGTSTQNFMLIGKVYKIGQKKGVLPETTAVAKWLGLWCMELRVACSNPGRQVDRFFVSSPENFGRLVVPYMMVL